MSDEGEKTCPLCAEEMDMTDQQLRPCKCGYQVCVWCWHHIMEMAEKDDTEGRCPACRTPYNKEKIVGMAAKCERLVSETNTERKLKSQKGKSKTSEGRKQLASVRVVQRNLVYVVGLPLNFADEDLLQRKEYFGQYGKVMKVSISRTAAGSVQQFANSTCSVYITYSKEEEAVRCIQAVHGFVLDTRPLRACFGTTKYCHAWLRNMPCTNPDCLYLHENGSQEDSFTKDEIISAYTRCKVPNISGSSNDMQRRSGNVLPPPADEYSYISTASAAKPITKAVTNTNIPTASVRVSPPNSSSGRSAALPAGASWGTRPSSSQPMPVSKPISNGQLKHKHDTGTATVPLSTAVASPALSLNSDSGNKSIPKEESPVSLDKGKTETFESTEKSSSVDGRLAVPDSSVASARPIALSINRQHHASPTSLPTPNTIRTTDSSVTSSAPPLETDPIDTRDGNMDNICSDVKSMSINENQQLQNGYVEHSGHQPPLQTSAKGAYTAEEVYLEDIQSNFRAGRSTQLQPVSLHELEDDLLSFDKQRIKDPAVATNRVPDFSNTFNLSKHSFRSPSGSNADRLVSVYPDRQAIDRNSNMLNTTSNFPSGYRENTFTGAEVNDVEYSNIFPNKERRSLLGKYDGEVASGAGDMGESSIISNILSMDFDSWDESLTSPQHLAKLLADKQGSLGVPNSRKIQNSNQSRFSFAREEEPISHVSGSGQSFDFSEQAFKQRPFGHDFSSSNSLHLEKYATRNDFPVFNSTESDPFASTHSPIALNKISVSRSQISAPPGFSVPSRAAPPGFTSHERTEQNLANHMLGASSFLRNQHQTSSLNNTYNSDDIEFMDPAILAVGKGTLPTNVSTGFDIRSSFSPQLSSYGEGRFESFLQRSLPPQQNQRYIDTGDSFSPIDDAYRLPSRVMEQSLANNFSPLSQYTISQSRNGVTPNGQWDGWNETHNNGNLGMAELFRNERLPFNKFYGGYEDPKIRMPNSGNLYNGTYGI